MTDLETSSGHAAQSPTQAAERSEKPSGPDQPRRVASSVGWREIVEWALILIWALWVGRAYLDLDPVVAPLGREFGEHAVPPWV